MRVSSLMCKQVTSIDQSESLSSAATTHPNTIGESGMPPID